MKYISTRDKSKKYSAAEVIKMGLSNEGGLFVPETVPDISIDEIKNLVGKSYQDIAKAILVKFLTDYTEKEIEDCISLAYNNFTFNTPDVVPLKKLNDNLYVMELWHGPTAAFKDMALQIMPHLLSKAIKKVKTDKETVILVATSGDTGKAALEGYKDIEGIKIIVFYPEGGVSKVQELQMSTTDGNNTYVAAVKGNFDDCQTGVKEIFGNVEFNKLLNDNGYELSSANSINWGRLVPQIIYYFKAYTDLVKNGEIKLGDEINFCIPTGNFGNILAGFYAKLMGLPVKKFICASNINNILTNFFKTGVYDRNRAFVKTSSPSMDILISSNLERFLFEMTAHDDKKVNQWYKNLKETGRFEVDTFTKEKMSEIVDAGFADEIETGELIETVFNTYNYVVDTHTAVALKVAGDFKSVDKIVVDSTANPYKFSVDVLKALSDYSSDDEFRIVNELNKITGLEIHRAVKGLDKKEVKHKAVIKKEEMKDIIKDILKI